MALLVAILLGLGVYAVSAANATQGSQQPKSGCHQNYVAGNIQVTAKIGTQDKKYGARGDVKVKVGNCYPKTGDQHCKSNTHPLNQSAGYGKGCKPVSVKHCAPGSTYSTSAYKCVPTPKPCGCTPPPVTTTPCPPSTTTTTPPATTTTTAPPVVTTTTHPVTPTTSPASPVTVVVPGTTHTVTEVVAVSGNTGGTSGGSSAGVPEVSRIPIGAAETGGGATSGTQHSVWFILGAALIAFAGLFTYFGTRRHTDGGAKA